MADIDMVPVCVCQQGQGMRDAEMLVWAGDFNYRIEVGYEEALEHIRNNDLDFLIDRVSPPALPSSPSEVKPEGRVLLPFKFESEQHCAASAEPSLKGTSCCPTQSQLLKGSKNCPSCCPSGPHFEGQVLLSFELWCGHVSLAHMAARLLASST